MSGCKFDGVSIHITGGDDRIAVWLILEPMMGIPFLNGCISSTPLKDL